MKRIFLITLITLVSIFAFSQSQNAKYITVPTGFTMFTPSGVAVGTIVTDLSTNQTWLITEYGTSNDNLLTVSKILFESTE